MSSVTSKWHTWVHHVPLWFSYSPTNLRALQHFFPSNGPTAWSLYQPKVHSVAWQCHSYKTQTVLYDIRPWLWLGCRMAARYQSSWWTVANCLTYTAAFYCYYTIILLTAEQTNQHNYAACCLCADWVELHGILTTDSTSRSSLQQDLASTAPVLTAAEYIAAVCLCIGIVLSSPMNVHGTSPDRDVPWSVPQHTCFWLVYNSMYMFLNSASVSICYVTHRQPLYSCASGPSYWWSYQLC